MPTETLTQREAAPAGTEGSLLDEILAESKMKPSDEGYDVARKGVEAFIAELLREKRSERIDRTAVDAMVAEIDRKLTAQVNEILHHPEVQKLESAWRGLKFAVDRIDFRENVRLEILSVDRETLQADLEDAADLTKSGFYRVAYTDEYGVLGGKPYGVMNLDYSRCCGGWRRSGRWRTVR
jgi:type VI secretion system protein ImpC